MDDRAFRGQFFRQLTLEALEPDSDLYVPIYDHREIAADDPVGLMQWTVEETVGASVQLFSGFRGSGKSTELRRLRRNLTDAGYTVLLIDAEDYLNLSNPVDVPDFLLAVAGAVGDEALAAGLLDDDPAKVSYWERFAEFLRGISPAEVSAEIGAGPAKVAVKANLRDNPTFVRTLQQRMAAHLGAFVQDVRAYLADVVRQIRRRHPRSAGVVLIAGGAGSSSGTRRRSSTI